MKKRNLKDVSLIIIHVSDSGYKHHDDISVIRKWHTDPVKIVNGRNVGGRGWDDVGYHYFIKRSGEVQKGRNLKIVGAHCRGKNHNSVGICMHGLTSDITQEQFQALTNLVINLKIKIDGIKTVNQHSEYDKKKPHCAGLTKDQVNYLDNLVK